MSNEILDKMTPKDLAMYWVQRRRLTWASMTALILITLLGAAGIEVLLGKELAWIFASIIFIYFLGNGVMEVVGALKGKR